MMKHSATILALLFLSLGLAGCVRSGTTSGPCDATGNVERPRRFDGETLTILDQGAFPSLASVKDAFKNLTGADIVQIDGGDAGSALKTALLSAGNPPADLLFGVDNALFFTEGVRAKCLYVPYESPNVSRINKTVVDVDLFRVDGDLWTTPLDHAYVDVNYDIRLDDDANGTHGPRTLQDLATTQWAPTFVTEDPRFSSPGLLFLLTTIGTFGEAGDYTWKDYWHDLLHNGALVEKGWTEAYVYHYTGGYGSYDPETFVGDRQVVVSYTTSPAVEVYFGTPSPPGVSMEPTKGVFPQYETLGILRGSKHVALAETFIDFALSAEFQNRNAPELAVYPVIDGIELPNEFTELATDPSKLPRSDLPPDAIKENIDRWIDEWVDLYQSERA